MLFTPLQLLLQRDFGSNFAAVSSRILLSRESLAGRVHRRSRPMGDGDISMQGVRELSLLSRSGKPRPTHPTSRKSPDGSSIFSSSPFCWTPAQGTSGHTWRRALGSVSPGQRVWVWRVSRCSRRACSRGTATILTKLTVRPQLVHAFMISLKS